MDRGILFRFSGAAPLIHMIHRAGFTLIELVMVILLIGILAAVAIPEFVDFRTDAKNSATQGALGGLRAGIAIGRASIALREADTAPAYPDVTELRTNVYQPAFHPVLAAQALAIVDKAPSIPQNPWTLATLPLAHFSSVADCSGLTQGDVLDTPADSRGWCYNNTNGTIWANSHRNKAANSTENTF